MMLELALPASLLALGAWLWHSMLGATELARAQARQLCHRAQLQLLDDTVSLQRMRLTRGTDGWLQCQRDYTFDVSTTGADRHAASLCMDGNKLLSYRLPSLEPPTLAAPRVLQGPAIT